MEASGAGASIASVHAPPARSPSADALTRALSPGLVPRPSSSGGLSCWPTGRSGKEHHRPHHSSVLVLEDVTVIHKLADRDRLVERHDHFHHTRLSANHVWQIHVVLQAHGVGRLSVDLCDEVVSLMYVKGVQLSRLVDDRELDHVTDVGIDVVSIPDELVATGDKPH